MKTIIEKHGNAIYVLSFILSIVLMVFLGNKAHASGGDKFYTGRHYNSITPGTKVTSFAKFSSPRYGYIPRSHCKGLGLKATKKVK